VPQTYTLETNMLAVIKSGGKQHLVSPGDKIKIEKIDKEEGEEVSFDQVLLLADDKGKIEIGAPFIKGAKIKAKVIKQGKGKKIIIFKYKPKKRYQKKMGHRQLYTEVEILSPSKKSVS
jgi:large subunit ribosomal protein L21